MVQLNDNKNYSVLHHPATIFSIIFSYVHNKFSDLLQNFIYAICKIIKNDASDLISNHVSDFGLCFNEITYWIWNLGLEWAEIIYSAIYQRIYCKIISFLLYNNFISVQLLYSFCIFAYFPDSILFTGLTGDYETHNVLFC